MPGFGILAHPWWVAVLYVLLLGHITNLCVTMYLHRSATHGGVKFGPPVEHFMRFWLWLTTGQVTREWVAVHRKHHAFADREGDPHSPLLEGLWKVTFGQVFYYQKAAGDPEVLEKYGKGCPDDWVERNVYTGRRGSGIMVMLAIDLFLFGPVVGLLVWLGMIFWMPLLGGVINGIGHGIGYRNFPTRDTSRNIYPFGFWVVGEELHNNHHADPRSAKFKAYWWEFDVAWVWIRGLSMLKLADIIYARSVTAKEFGAKHFREQVTEPVAGRIERARERLDGMRERLEHASEGLEHAMAQVRERMESARDLPEAARQRLRVARDRLEAARVRVREALDHVRSGAQAELEVAREKKDQARERLEEAVTQARAALEFARSTLEQAGA
ncbi:MAG: fatty acid desaturase [Gemmatimonadota bacterium]